MQKISKHIYHIYLYFRGVIDVATGWFETGLKNPSGWAHVVINFMGPNDGEGFTLFVNGKEGARDTSLSAGVRPEGDGRIVLGQKAHK